MMLRLTGAKDGRGRPEWLRVIHAANEVEPGMFGAPVSAGPWWAGGYAEEYADARVVLDDDGSARVVAKTARGESVLRQAAEASGIHTGGAS
jgi:hypothetical protein